MSCTDASFIVAQCTCYDVLGPQVPDSSRPAQPTSGPVAACERAARVGTRPGTSPHCPSTLVVVVLSKLLSLRPRPPPALASCNDRSTESRYITTSVSYSRSPTATVIDEVKFSLAVAAS